MTLSYSYVGLLDDFAARHADTAIADLDDLNEKLVLAALFSGPMLINDGYVLLHPAIRQALLNPKKSPLKALVESGFVKLLSRNSNALGDLAQTMADAGIDSAKSLLRSESFAKEYQPLLERWSGELSSGAFDAFMSWPKLHVDKVYRSIGSAVLNTESLASSLTEAVTKAFAIRLADTASRRTEWERVANDLQRAGMLPPAAYAALMHAANETYQYAWGCALTTSLSNVRVLTRLPKHLGSLDVAESELSARPKKAVEVMIPDRAFVVKAVAEKWESLAVMVAPGHELNRLKHGFLGALRSYYADDKLDRRQVTAAANQYTTALSKHFGGKVAVPVVFDLSFVGLSTAAGSFAGPAGAAVGATVGVVGVAAAHLGVPRLLWRLAAPSPKKWLLHKRLAAPEGTTSCFAIDPAAAALHTSGARRP
jgi:hypothetical protein